MATGTESSRRMLTAVILASRFGSIGKVEDIFLKYNSYTVVSNLENESTKFRNCCHNRIGQSRHKYRIRGLVPPFVPHLLPPPSGCCFVRKYDGVTVG